MREMTPLGPIIVAKTVGRNGQGSSGLTDAQKQAIYQCFEDVAWEDPDTRAADLSALFAALYPVTALAAVYTQSGTVYETDNLDALEDDLVVTATYEDGTTGVIPAGSYTLSGTLTEGSSTITVTFSGKAATFTVNVETAIWHTKNEAFNGGYISTLTPICETDADFTFALDVTLTTNPSSGDASTYRLIRVLTDGSEGYTIALYKKTTNSTQYTAVWMDGAAMIGSIGTGRLRLVVTHTRNSGKAVFYAKKDDGSVASVEISGSFTASSKSLIFGYSSGANQLPKGTITYSAIYDTVFGQANIDDFMGV